MHFRASRVVWVTHRFASTVRLELFLPQFNGISHIRFSWVIRFLFLFRVKPWALHDAAKFLYEIWLPTHAHTQHVCHKNLHKNVPSRRSLPRIIYVYMHVYAYV